MESMEQIAFLIISSAGEAQSAMLQALQAAKENDFDKADELMRQSEDYILKAHQAQTQLIVEEANGNKSEYSILMVHAQDHLMNGILSSKLIREMIDLYKKIA